MSTERMLTRDDPDATGLICGYRFAPGAPPQALDPAQLEDELAPRRERAQDDGSFVWLHFNLANAAALRWLQRHGGLPAAFYDAMSDEMRSTRIEREEDVLIAVVNDIRFDFDFTPEDLSTLWLCVNDRLVVTARRAPQRSIDRLRSAVKGGQALRSTVELLEHLFRAQADVLVEIVRDATRRTDRVEDALLVGRLSVKRARLGSLRRLLVRLQRLLAPEPASLLRLLQHPPAWMDADDAQQLREAAEEFSVALRDMAALQERTRLLQEEVAAMVDERNGRTLFVLTVVTVLALPINIIAGLFGMNVGGLPLAQHPHGFWIVTAIVATFTGAAGWIAFRRRDDD
jgi:zinc transporter